MTIVKQEKTLLDEFAMAALTGLCSMPSGEFDKKYGKCNCVDIAYMLAGMMLDERKRYKFNHETPKEPPVSMKTMREEVRRMQHIKENMTHDN